MPVDTTPNAPPTAPRTPTVPAPTPTVPPPTAPPTAPPAPEPPSPFAAELARLQGELNRHESAERARADAVRVAEQRQLVAQGQSEELARRHAEDLSRRDAEHTAFVGRFRDAERRRAVVEAIAGSGRTLVPGAIGQLVQLWSPEFETVDGPDGSFSVRSRTDLRPARDVVAARLAATEWAHFVAADGRGGSGGGGGATPAPTPGVTPAPVPTGQPMSDFMFAELLARRQSQQVPSWFANRVNPGSGPNGA